ncbi:hypothetical protein FQN54_002623 [Arachnomyces sp. PD_36]|nr:hypothetical protein FQN54_002623 [Arachnomyces sp. PD_36]
MAPVKVAVIGATGETGSSIIKGLFASPTEFEITTLTRQESVHKSENETLRQLGIKVIPYDARSPVDELAKMFMGIKVVVSAVGPPGFMDQIPLATAARKARVHRFVPCSFAPVTPPRTVIEIRDRKEDVVNHIKKIRLPYTWIDVGWWFQGLIPSMPSGRTDYAKYTALTGDNMIPGDGNIPNAMTDVRDVGRYVAMIITDPRTLNKMVFAYSEVLTANQAYDVMEALSGEKIQRNYIKAEELEADIDESRKSIIQTDADFGSVMTAHFLQYYYSWGIRGDNTPENAEYLGYNSSKDLYPDFKPAKFSDFVKDLLNGKVNRVYAYKDRDEYC